MLAALAAPSLLLLIERRFLRILRQTNFHASMKFACRRVPGGYETVYRAIRKNASSMLAALAASSLFLLIERRFLRVLRQTNFHASMKFACRCIPGGYETVYRAIRKNASLMLAALAAPSLLLLIERRFLRVLRQTNFHASMKFARRRIRVNCVKMY